MERLKSRFPIYGRLLHLYPSDYQHNYSEQILQTLADMLDDPSRSKPAVWTRALLDFPISVSRQQLIYTGVAMANDVPNYVKRNALLGAVLLLPFPVAVVIHSLTNPTQLAAHRWEAVYLSAFMVLPAAAFLFCLVTFLYWVFERRRQTESDFWKNLIDVRRNWLITLVASLGLLMALFVPLHDSVHCLTGNPIRELAHSHQTWQCVRQSR